MIRYLRSPTVKGEVPMHVTANRDFGLVIQGLLRERYLAAGVEPPHFQVGTLGETLGRIARAINQECTRTGLTQEQFMQASDFNPVVQYCTRIFLPMVWTSLLAPERTQEVTQILRHMQRWFKLLGYEPLTDAEIAELEPRLIELASQRQPDGALGAAGDGLLCSVHRRLEGYSPGAQGGQRRRRFLQDAYYLCQTVEESTSTEDRRAAVDLLAERLQMELQRSGCKTITGAMETFKMEYELFFADDRLTG